MNSMSNKSKRPLQCDWQSYICKMNGELASVYVDLSLSSYAPFALKPKLAWVWIKLNSPRHDGLSSDDEFESLCVFEDDLEDALASYDACEYVGRITTKGRREFYFYTDSDFDFKTAVNDVLVAHPEFSFQCGEKLDTTWGHYFSTLFPASNGMEQIERRKAQQ